MPFQNTLLKLKECWFECTALDQFDVELSNFCMSHEGSVFLSNIPDVKVFEFSKNNETLESTFFATDTVGMGKSSLTAKGYSNELLNIFENLKSFEKWW